MNKMNKMKHLKSINETLGDGTQEFVNNFTNIDVTADNMPQYWKDRDLNIGENGRIKWSLTINMSKRGIEWFSTAVKQIVFFGSFEDDEEIEFEVQDNVETELYDITDSFYPNAIEVNMKKSLDVQDWTVKVYFGNP